MAHEILIVDDEPDIRALIEGILSDEGYETRQAANSDQALAAFKHAPAIPGGARHLAAEHRGWTGSASWPRCIAKSRRCRCVMISGHGTIETAVQAIQHGAYDFIEKPFKSDRLLLVVARALEAARLRRENSELRLRAGRGDRAGGRPRPGVHSCARRSTGWRRPAAGC